MSASYPDKCKAEFYSENLSARQENKTMQGFGFEKPDNHHLARRASRVENPVSSWLEEDDELFDLLDPKAVAANQRGEITRAQRACIKTAHLFSPWWSKASFFIVLVLGELFLWTGLRQTEISSIILIILYIAGVGGCWVLFPLISCIHRWRLKRKVERGHIRHIQGEVVRLGP